MKKITTVLSMLLFMSISSYAQTVYSGESGSFNVTLSCDAYQEVNSSPYYISADGNTIKLTILGDCSLDGWDGIDVLDWAEIYAFAFIRGDDGPCDSYYCAVDYEETEIFYIENEDTIEIQFFLETFICMYDATCTFNISYEVVD